MLPGENLHHDDNSQVQAISQALNATLDPHISNDIRRQALEFLEQVKTQPDAPYNGFTLASQTHQPQAVRYFGLQLLEHAVKYQWSRYNSDQTVQLRRWIVTLAHRIVDNDATFYRNKVGQIWVECAKRSWGEEWIDMDEDLLDMWEETAAAKQPANRLLVLYILEMLAEDICNREDAVAGLRLEVLGSALNEIVIPQELYQSHIQGRAKGRTSEARQSHEGWLNKICTFLGECIQQLRMDTSSTSYSLCATKGLHTLRALVSWLSLKAIIEVNCVGCLLQALCTANAEIKIAAIDTLHAVLSRPTNPHFQDLELTILSQVLQVESIAILSTIYQGEQFVPSTDDAVYTLQKKASEVLSLIANALLHHESDKFKADGIDELFKLLFEVFQNQSLVISIPILHSWTKLLASLDQHLVDRTMQALGILVDICSQRLLNFEMLGEEHESTIVQYLFQDFETTPERHAFVGNYRRYAASVIENISRKQPVEAITHVFTALQLMLESGRYSKATGFDIATYSKSAMSVLQFDAQYTIACGVVRGYLSWEKDTAIVNEADPSKADIIARRKSVLEALLQWTFKAINLQIDDPEVVIRVLTLISSIVRNTLAGHEILLPAVQYVLSTHMQIEPSAIAYTDSLNALEGVRVHESQKIAAVFADELFKYFAELEQKVREIIQMQSDDDRLVWGFRAFLLIIVHRTTLLDESERTSRLKLMIEPLISAWQDQALQQAVTSKDTFYIYLGLGALPTFYQQHRFAETEDWTTAQLGSEGQQRQAEIRTATERLPLRSTKAMMNATLERVTDGSREHQTACIIWKSSLSVILPPLLQMIRHAQAYSNPEIWSHLSADLQAVFKRSLQDRFWQSGISNETRDDFVKRVSGSKSSYEGFASTVRGVMRNIREQAYVLLFLLARFEEQFYGLVDLPDPLSHALFEDADQLPTHHLQYLLTLTTGLVKHCPPQHRQRFLPPLLTRFFVKLDKKINGDWQAIVRVNQETAEDDDLSEEMRVESVLRQLTFAMVSFVVFLLNNDKQEGSEQPRPYLTDVVLSDVLILEPLIMFCTHALRIPDSRCCKVVCKILYNTVAQFAVDTAPGPRVREFVSTEVFKAGITSLNEPYFADVQNDLAGLLAQILLLYSSKSDTPRSILLTLPNMRPGKTDETINQLCKTKSARQQRALVLDLLDGVRGISIYEAGKIARQDGAPKKAHVQVQAQYMDVEQQPSIVNGNDAGLDGISDLFAGL